jgi:hypothetical protein
MVPFRREYVHDQDHDLCLSVLSNCWSAITVEVKTLQNCLFTGRRSHVNTRKKYNGTLLLQFFFDWAEDATATPGARYELEGY